MPKKLTDNNRLYFISNNIEDDLITLKNNLQNNNNKFIDNIYKSKIQQDDKTTYFINIKVLIELTNDDFDKISKKINKILNKNYKLFYKDRNNKFTYTPIEIVDDYKTSLYVFIKDD